uniref:Uncharacterized protein n=1 Tax=Steinernema glaseri TaxID=37863 RepID=A0A1I7ZML5_9BILA
MWVAIFAYIFAFAPIDAAKDEWCTVLLNKVINLEPGRSLFGGDEAIPAELRSSQPILSCDCRRPTSLSSVVTADGQPGHHFLLEAYGTFRTMDGRNLITSLADASGCIASKGTCKKEEYTLIWKTDEISPCYHQNRGNFTAYRSEHQVLIHDLNTALTYANPPKNEFSRRCYGDRATIMSKDIIMTRSPKTAHCKPSLSSERCQVPPLEKKYVGLMRDMVKRAEGKEDVLRALIRQMADSE